MNKEKLNANMEYLKDLNNKSNELKEEYDVINKNETEYIKKYNFKERLENTEVSNAINEFDNNLKDNIKKRDMLVYEKNVIYNNIDLVLMDIIKCDLLPILKKYEGKLVGEKTKEKMKNDIKSYVLEHYNLTCYFSVYKKYEFSGILLSFGFYELDNNYVNINTKTYVRINKRDIKLDTNVNNYNEIIYNMDKLYPYYVNYDYKYVELDSVSGYASNLYNMRVLTETNIKKLNDEISKLKNDFNSYCLNNLNDYRI